MRIIDRRAFMEQPSGVIFATGGKWHFGGWARKDGNCGDNDFFMTDLDWTQFHGNENSGLLVDIADRALASGESLRMHFDDGCRAAGFDRNALFAILEPNDIKTLIQRLQEALR